MASLLQRLDEEEAIVRGELDVLRAELAVAEERLIRLAITRETALQLLGGPEPDAGTVSAPAQAPATPERAWDPAAPAASAHGGQEAQSSAPASGFTPMASTRHPSQPTAEAQRLDWAEGLERILSLLATSGRAMRAREITAAIGEEVSPARIETTRGRCKSLVKEGKAVEVEPGCFRIAVPQSTPAQAPAGEEASRAA
ncbi:hypothetical protein ACIQ9P_38330 [Kitasatospora sp. NPDC094019]|uniref:hypothetical protein n=1 Tax=Kitasatospora sp. NPDC094019 TaxID=3364091 RepID=UPI003811FE8C